MSLNNAKSGIRGDLWFDTTCHEIGTIFHVYGLDSKTNDLYKGSNANTKWAPINGAIESCLPIGMEICYPLCIP